MSDRTNAEARAAAARLRLSNTVEALKARLEPRTIARDTVETLTDNSERALRSGVDVARRNPGLFAGGIAVIGLWLARDKVKALAVQMLPKRRRTPKPAANPDVLSTYRPAPTKRNPS